MSIQPLGSTGGPPPRTHGTPSGYRNVRVLAPCPLHFRLVAYAGLSMCSLNEFILKVLHLATPIDPATGLPVPAGTPEPAPGQRPIPETRGGPGLARISDTDQEQGEPALRQRPSGDLPDVPGPAAGPGAAPLPEAQAWSNSDPTADLTPSGSFPIRAPDRSSSITVPDTANAGGHAHV